jgi:site-specific recombinase XerD
MNKHDLISKYKHQLILKNFSESTLKSYMSCLHLFLNYVSKKGWSEISGERLRQYFIYCKSELCYSYSTIKQHLAAVRFLYVEVLNKPIDFDFNIKMKKPSTIPEVLSVEEVQRFLNTFTNLKHKAIFSLCYSAGLRVGEVINLTISNIDSDRMQIRISQAKGKKDRYSILSPKVLELLRQYVTEYKPELYLFEGQNGGKYSSSSIQSLMRKHRKLANIK